MTKTGSLKTNNNNNKTCYAHVSTLLGVQGETKFKFEENKNQNVEV